MSRKLEAVRAFMERVHQEANALADQLDPKHTRKGRTEIETEAIRALDQISSRAFNFRYYFSAAEMAEKRAHRA